MYIKKLKLQGVGRFDQVKELQFNQGLNIMTGANEAGKSTVVKAIETSLFGFKPMKDWKYANWSQKETTIECLLQHKNEELLVTRKYGSKIRGTTLAGHIAENIGNQPLESNLVDLELYKSLFSISVDELAGIDKKSWKELTASLTDAYNHSAFKSAAEAQEMVEQKASEIYRENGRGQYEMKRLLESQMDVEAQIKQLEIERSYAVRSEEEIKSIKGIIETLNRQLQETDKKIRFYEENHQRIRRRREYKQKLADYQQIEMLELPEKPLVERWMLEQERERLVNSEIDRIENELVVLRDKVNQIEDLYHSRKSDFPKIRSALAGLMGIVAIGFSVYSFPDGFNQIEQMGIGILAVLTVALILDVGFVSTKKRRKSLSLYDQNMAGITQSIALSEMQRHHFEDELEELTAFQLPLKEACERLGMNGPQEMLEWSIKAAYLANALDNLLEQEEDPDEFLLTIGENSGQQTPEEVELKVLLDERDRLSQLKNEQEQKISHSTDLSVKEIDYRLNGLRESLHTGKEQLMESAFVRDKLLLVSKIVAEAEILYRKSQKPDFLIRASRYMSLLSDEKYNEILMSESGGFVLRAGNELIPISETISRGSKEQMYLALKLAMTFRLDPLGHYPILMDEIAINFDNSRRKGLASVLKELSEQRQVIYMTCHEWFVDEISQSVGSHIVNLNE